jgi:hypothetical protein
MFDECFHVDPPNERRNPEFPETPRWRRPGTGFRSLRSGLGGLSCVFSIRLQHQIAHAILGVHVANGAQQREAATLT